MARTRSTKGTAAAAKADTAKTTSTSSVYSLPPEADVPSRFFILPKRATAAAQIVTLQNPRYGKPTRYLVDPDAGFFEFTKITPPKSAPRSWLLENARLEDGTAPGKLEMQITSSPELYVATPIDPLFLLLPALTSTEGCKAGDDAKGPKKRMFLSSDDHFDALCGAGSHLADVLTWPKARELLVARMGAACDTVEAGDEPMFRLNESKLVGEILSKAKRMADQGLPKSMEEKFVIKALEAPILGVKSSSAPSTGGKSPRETSTPSGTEESNSPQPDAADSQSTISSVETSASAVSEASTAATSVSGDAAPAAEIVASAITASEPVTRLQRLRVAFNFICSSYIAPPLAATLKDLLASSSSSTVDFKPLDEYHTQLTKLRQEAAAARSTDYSRKRARDEEADERAEKKRKKDEEEKVKKANQSRGVKNLAKVNTAGMRKMSDFFKKK